MNRSLIYQNGYMVVNISQQIHTQNEILTKTNFKIHNPSESNCVDIFCGPELWKIRKYNNNMKKNKNGACEIVWSFWSVVTHINSILALLLSLIIITTCLGFLFWLTHLLHSRNLFGPGAEFVLAEWKRCFLEFLISNDFRCLKNKNDKNTACAFIGMQFDRMHCNTKSHLLPT